MPSFMSISARVQELFRENRGGRDKPPRRSMVKVSTMHVVVIQTGILTLISRGGGVSADIVLFDLHRHNKTGRGTCFVCNEPVNFLDSCGVWRPKQMPGNYLCNPAGPVLRAKWLGAGVGCSNKPQANSTPGQRREKRTKTLQSSRTSRSYFGIF